MSNMFIDENPLDDYIIAKGNSGKWSYIKYANGFAMCWGNWELTNEAYTSTAPGLPYGHTFEFAFPFSFHASPIVLVTGRVGNGFAFSSTSQVRLNKCNILLSGNSNSTNCEVWLMVQGLWKALS